MGRKTSLSNHSSPSLRSITSSTAKSTKKAHSKRACASTSLMSNAEDSGPETTTSQTRRASSIDVEEVTA